MLVWLYNALTMLFAQHGWQKQGAPGFPGWKHDDLVDFRVAPFIWVKTQALMWFPAYFDYGPQPGRFSSNDVCFGGFWCLSFFLDIARIGWWLNDWLLLFESFWLSDRSLWQTGKTRISWSAGRANPGASPKNSRTPLELWLEPMDIAPQKKTQFVALHSTKGSQCGALVHLQVVYIYMYICNIYIYVYYVCKIYK